MIESRGDTSVRDTFDVHLTLTRDKPNSMDFRDTYRGLENVWYKIEADTGGNVTLRPNADGFEHLARYLLKMEVGFHAQHNAEFGRRDDGPEFTVILTEHDEPPTNFSQ
jgi:hypothetical protein